MTSTFCRICCCCLFFFFFGDIIVSLNPNHLALPAALLAALTAPRRCSARTDTAAQFNRTYISSSACLLSHYQKLREVSNRQALSLAFITFVMGGLFTAELQPLLLFFFFFLLPSSEPSHFLRQQVQTWADVFEVERASRLIFLLRKATAV